MIRDLMKETKSRMDGALKSLTGDLAAFRTGRANPHLVDRIVVEYYGSEIPLNQMAVVSVPEAHQIAIRPYDAGSVPAIERAILKSDLGIMPNNDGKIIRLNIPRLTEERRRDLSKMMSKRVEEAKVAVRNVRRDALNDLRDFEKEKMITEDDLHRGIDDLNDLTEEYIKQIDEIGEKKEAEIMEV
ncbi:MAG: ribosome recycling factor [Candidatus Promineifilaceae bacterium]|jgi:ribosome recycling factor